MQVWNVTTGKPYMDSNPLNPVQCLESSCMRTWDDGIITAITPAPAGRCPFEYDHEVTR